MAAAVFIDRDGVLNVNEVRNGKPYAPTRAADFRLLPGVEDAARRLKEAGFLLIVATNQPDIANGITAQAELDAMHALLRKKVPVDDIRICYHTDADRCDCRKPRPGLLLAAAQDHGIDLPRSYMVGDRWRDVAAGKAAGCAASVLVKYDYDEPEPDSPDAVVASLSEAADWILRREQGK
ncbi:MAG: D-glycero-alpha-D-manno-heptose-1,7-bisphosphate 7-phosphatase [Alphaproteobacteria bacterium]